MAKRKQETVQAVPAASWANRITGYGEEAPGNLIANPFNFRTHPPAQEAALSGVLSQIGLVAGATINRTTGHLLDGHLRISMAISQGQATVPVTYIEVSEDEEKLLLAAFDQINSMAGRDSALLDALLSDVRASDVGKNLGTGLDDLLAALQAECASLPAAVEGEDDAPPLPEAPVSVLGDMWIMDRHRLLVGDSTSADAVNRLMGGHRADLVFTDPPYNVDYEGYTDEKLKIQGDRMTAAAFLEFLGKTFRNCVLALKPGGSMYICHASSSQRAFQNELEAAGFDVRCQIIWAKNTFAWGFGRYKFQHEPIFYCHLSGQKDRWYGDKSQSTLWQEKKPAANRLHPTMKPVELIDRAIVNSSKSGDIVLDLFGGSGSTLISAEKSGRNARLMELDLRYADVIVARWERFSGKQAIHQETGATFEHVKSGRRLAVQDALKEEASTAVRSEVAP